MSRATLFAILTILTAITAYQVAKQQKRHRFASARAHEVAAGAQELFDRGDASYASFRAAIKSADPVLHADARRLWRQKALTPEAIDGVLAAPPAAY